MNHRTIILFLFLTVLVNIWSAPVALSQTAAEQFESGLNSTAGKMGYETRGTAVLALNQQTGRIIQAVLASVGVLFLILMIYGGFIWMTARGNEQQVTKARSIIINALIGLAVVLVAYAITTLAVKFWEETADV